MKGFLLIAITLILLAAWFIPTLLHIPYVEDGIWTLYYIALFFSTIGLGKIITKTINNLD